jgi:type I restriction enzyme, S subunit
MTARNPNQEKELGDKPLQILVADIFEKEQMITETIQEIQSIIESDQSGWKDEHDYIPLKKVLNRSKEENDIEDEKSYRQVTVKLHHRGLVLRRECVGKEIKTKRQFTIRQNQLLLSRIDARNGAIGIVTKEFDGAIISNDFWAFNIDNNIIDPEFLLYYTQSKKFLNDCDHSSTGTTHRKRLQDTLFLNQLLPLPNREIQHKIVSIIKKMDEIQKLQIQSEKEINITKTAVMNQMLGYRYSRN